MKRSGFGLRAELSLGMVRRGEGGGGVRWLEGLGGQKRGEGQGVCGAVGERLLCAQSPETH